MLAREGHARLSARRRHDARSWRDAGRVRASGFHWPNLNRVIDYPADDLTITVEAGMTIAD